MTPTPSSREQAMGMTTWLCPQPGIGGHLRQEPEDFRVIELGAGPRPKPDTDILAVRIRLRNWETNRFVGIASRRMGIKSSKVGFGGMKDKRAVTEQWFTFQLRKFSEDPLAPLRELDDVEILESHTVAERMYPGAHDGNRFILRASNINADANQEALDEMTARITENGGVPRFFGPQRFGAAFRPVTHLVGAAIVAGDLEEAVRLYLGHPLKTEREEAYEARKVYEETRDAEAALAVFPGHLDFERYMLERLVRKPGDWRNSLMALPKNLLQLFIHSNQSWVFNHILSERIKQGWSLQQVQLGDRVCAEEDDGTVTHVVTPWNQERIQREVHQGRAAATALLPGLEAPLAEGAPGEVEQAVLERLKIDVPAYRVSMMPHLASAGRRRTVLQWVHDLEANLDGDAAQFAFSLGKGDYATTVLREYMKADVDAY